MVCGKELFDLNCHDGDDDYYIDMMVVVMMMIMLMIKMMMITLMLMIAVIVTVPQHKYLQARKSSQPRSDDGLRVSWLTW